MAQQRRRGALSVCSVPGCPTLARGRCDEHKRTAERQRGSAAERGYGGAAWTIARRTVLMRDPICVVCKHAFATVADHWPVSRRDLVAQGVRNPDSPRHLRALCASCHGKETAREQPGGWNQRD